MLTDADRLIAIKKIVNQMAPLMAELADTQAEIEIARSAAGLDQNKEERKQ